jgi:hypothetical protein
MAKNANAIDEAPQLFILGHPIQVDRFHACRALRSRWKYPVGNYEKAYRETLHFMVPKVHWGQLLTASICGHLGKIKY